MSSVFLEILIMYNKDSDDHPARTDDIDMVALMPNAFGHAIMGQKWAVIAGNYKISKVRLIVLTSKSQVSLSRITIIVMGLYPLASGQQGSRTASTGGVDFQLLS